MNPFQAPSGGTVARAPAARRSAEQFITTTLIGVCAVAGAGIWLASRGDRGNDSDAARAAPATSAAIHAAAPANDWQGQLDGEVGKLEHAREQEQRNVEAASAAAQQRERERQDLDRRQRELAAQAAALAAASAKSARASSESAVAVTAMKSSAVAAVSAPELVPARIINDSCAPPEYPASAERLQQEGQVILGFQIDAQGRVLDQRVDKSSGYAQLDNAAAKALGRCRFAPATLGGVAQTAWTQVRFTWKLNR
ncbi:MAG: energy transducer TonB [Solimonas sp.]